MKKFNPFYCSGMRSAFFSGLLAAFFCFSPVDVSAQALTQQNVEDAFYNALMAFTEDSSGTPGMFINFPLDLNSFADLGSYLTSTAYHTTVGDSAYLTLASLVGVDPRFWDFLRTLSPSNQLASVIDRLVGIENNTWHIASDSGWIATYAGDIDSRLGSLLQSLTFVSGRNGSALLVTDPEVLDALQSLDQSVSGYGATLGDIRDNTATLDSIQGYFSSVAGDLSAWREEWNGAQSLYEQQDSSSRTNAAIALRDAESDYHTEETTALQEVEDLDPPTAVDNYVPTPPDEDLAGSDMGLGSVDANVIHDARITLIPNRRSGASASWSVPPIEIDYGRMSSLVSGMESFADWADWLYGSLFAILFSVKGIHMWRVFRVASLQASVGVDPQISLSWDPF